MLQIRTKKRLIMILHLKNSSIGGEAVRVKKCRGMTLVELVAAMAILGIVLVSASMLILTIVKYNYIMKCKVTNSSIAQRVIEYYKSCDFSTSLDKELVKVKSNDYCEQYIYFTENPTCDDLISRISADNFAIYSVSKDKIYSEIYDKVVNNHPPADLSQKYDHVIKVVFEHKDDDMLAIDVTVWDSKNKDFCKVEYVTLKGY